MDRTVVLERCSHVDSDGRRCEGHASVKNSWSARSKGCRTYCERHKGGGCARKPRPACSFPGCRAESTRDSAKAHRRTGSEPHCAEHRHGRRATALPRPSRAGRAKLFTIRMTDEERERAERVSKSVGLNVAGVIRILLKEKDDELRSRGSRTSAA